MYTRVHDGIIVIVAATIRMLSCTLDIPCPYTEILCLLSSPSLLPLLPPSSLPCFIDSRVVILLSILRHLHYHISNCDDLPDKSLDALGSILMLLHDQDAVSGLLQTVSQPGVNSSSDRGWRNCDLLTQGWDSLPLGLGLRCMQPVWFSQLGVKWFGPGILGYIYTSDFNDLHFDMHFNPGLALPVTLPGVWLPLIVAVPLECALCCDQIHDLWSSMVGRLFQNCQ